MRSLSVSENEMLAAEGFNAQSFVFDLLYAQDVMIAYKRRRVREHVNRYLAPSSHILELNAGTCEDAIYFSNNGHTIRATDISEGMLQQADKKIQELGLQDRICLEKRSFTQLNDLQQKGPYDMVFSNFAGLNCTDRLADILSDLPGLVKPGGMVTMVLLPPFCLWETLLFFRGKFGTAFRRFHGKKGTPAHVEGSYFRCYYYRASFVARHLSADFDLLSVEGLCTISPPSYLQGFAKRRPGLYRLLCRWEDKWKEIRPWKYIGDYYIISLRRKGA